MRMFLTLALIVTWVASARAETVVIRSGEHADHTRLTMTLPSRISWEVETTDTGARLLLRDGGLALDTSAVFDRIPKKRLTALAWKPADRALQMTFGCDCEPNIFWHEDTMLVVDIRARLNGSETDAASAQSKEPILPGAHPTADVLRPQSRAVDMALDALDKAESESSRIPAETRQKLLQQIGRAASQGLLAPHFGRPHELAKEDAPHADETTAQAEAQSEDNAPERLRNLRAQSSADRDFLASLTSRENSFEQSLCLAHTKVDVAHWGQDRPFGTQISELNLRLTGEFDQPVPEVAEALVKLYLYFGFGAEARVALNMVPEEVTERAVLAALAEIAEQGHAHPDSPLSGQLDCSPTVALWSALSYENLPLDAAMDTDAILRGFGALPAHLRAYYGPILSTKFLRSDRAEISERILRILDRREDTVTPQSTMADADLHVARGETEQADASLESVVASNSEPSAEALIRMIETRFASNREISYEQAQLAGAYAHEHRKDTIGLTLAAAHVRALVASGAIDQAFATYAENFARYSEGQGNDLRNDLLARLAEYPDELVFLRHALSPPHHKAVGLRPDVANAVADRLLTMGFTDAAAEFIAMDIPPGHPSAPNRQMLRARLALANGKPRLAIVELLEQSGKDADALRAEALSMAGDHANAAHLYAAADQPAPARRQAFLGAEWALAAHADDTVYSDLATLMTKDETIPDDTAQKDSIVLARNRDLLDDSAVLRSTLGALLAVNPPPDTQSSDE